MSKADDIKHENTVNSSIQKISYSDHEKKNNDATNSNNTNTDVTHFLAGRTTCETLDIDGMSKADDIKHEKC